MSLVILIVLVLGVGAGYLMPADVSGFLDSASTYMLLLLLFSVGIDTGLNKAVFTRIRELGFRILLIPFGVALGSLCGGVVTDFRQENLIFKRLYAIIDAVDLTLPESDADKTMINRKREKQS